MRMTLAFTVLVLASAYGAERMLDFADYLRTSTSRNLIQVHDEQAQAASALAEYSSYIYAAGQVRGREGEWKFALQFATTPILAVQGNARDYSAIGWSIRDGQPVVLDGVEPEILDALRAHLKKTPFAYREEKISDQITIMFPVSKS